MKIRKTKVWNEDIRDYIWNPIFSEKNQLTTSIMSAIKKKITFLSYFDSGAINK